MGKAGAILFLLVCVLPLLIFEIPTILSVIPKKIQKFLCFVPCGAIGFFSIKKLLEGDIGLFAIFIFFFCITLYGGFTVKDILSSND